MQIIDFTELKKRFYLTMLAERKVRILDFNFTALKQMESSSVEKNNRNVR